MTDGGTAVIVTVHNEIDRLALTLAGLRRTLAGFRHRGRQLVDIAAVYLRRRA